MTVREQMRAIVRLGEAAKGFDGTVAAQTLYEIAAACGARPRQRREAVIFGMYITGGIGKAELQAANEIEQVFQAITSACAGRTANYAPERGVATADLPKTLSEAYLLRYTPWRDLVGSQGVKWAATVGDLVLMAVVDNVGLRQISDRYWMDQRSVGRIIRDGLAEYVRIAGW